MTKQEVYIPPEVSNHPAFIKLQRDHASLQAKYDAAKIVIQQQSGTARREWPDGRNGADDDGQLAFAIAHDEKTNEVSLEFGKSVQWFSMNPQTAIDVSIKLYETANAILFPDGETDGTDEC